MPRGGVCAPDTPALAGRSPVAQSKGAPADQLGVRPELDSLSAAKVDAPAETRPAPTGGVTSQAADQWDSGPGAGGHAGSVT